MSENDIDWEVVNLGQLSTNLMYLTCTFMQGGTLLCVLFGVLQSSVFYPKSGYVNGVSLSGEIGFTVLPREAPQPSS